MMCAVKTLGNQKIKKTLLSRCSGRLLSDLNQTFAGTIAYISLGPVASQASLLGVLKERTNPVGREKSKMKESMKVGGGSEVRIDCHLLAGYFPRILSPDNSI